MIGPAEAPTLAALHAAAFPPDQRWGADAIRLLRRPTDPEIAASFRPGALFS